ncbi:MAG: hypothetical protein AVDCRST_MAG93-1918 [uncultured Chloroflexia bacterium]|uniref:Uncharacterized protein n=1 Tax=uncultured Chloroflexia bacterium TaxID=1672391 RepID=A0A6J4IMW5_9CHLR|nr:MAG: hypothetical protein AVDCRST_MAG93-1918 [uncultured Chloroflexia bacterium]
MDESTADEVREHGILVRLALWLERGLRRE